MSANRLDFGYVSFDYFEANSLEFVANGVYFNYLGGSIDGIFLPSLRVVEGEDGIVFNFVGLNALPPSVNLGALESVPDGPISFLNSEDVVLQLPGDVEIDGESDCLAYRATLASGGAREDLGTPNNIVCL